MTYLKIEAEAVISALVLLGRLAREERIIEEYEDGFFSIPGRAEEMQKGYEKFDAAFQKAKIIEEEENEAV